MKIMLIRLAAITASTSSVRMGASRNFYSVRKKKRRIVKEKEGESMAEKRMFTTKIINSDPFKEMPLSAQALYFHLGRDR